MYSVLKFGIYITRNSYKNLVESQLGNHRVQIPHSIGEEPERVCNLADPNSGGFKDRSAGSRDVSLLVFMTDS